MTPPPKPAPSPWNLPNLLTVLRILLVPVFGWFLLADGGRNAAYRLVAFGVFLVAMLTDRVDGHLARKRGQVTSFGMIADPIADKALLGMAFVGLSLLGEVPWWVTVLVLGREIAVTAGALPRDPAWGHARRSRRQAQDRAAGHGPVVARRPVVGAAR